MNHRVSSLASIRIFRAGILAVLICSLSSLTWTQQSPKPSSAANSKQNSVSRGEYIVERVAVCGQCHTPRDSQGRMDKSKSLQGGPLWLQSAQPAENWPQSAPRIAGNPPGSDPDMIKLLTTGIGRDGKPLRAPMPQFRMTNEDAQAVVAYLRSLTPQK